MATNNAPWSAAPTILVVPAAQMDQLVQETHKALMAAAGATTTPQVRQKQNSQGDNRATSAAASRRSSTASSARATGNRSRPANGTNHAG
jgi:hypothetical protein